MDALVTDAQLAAAVAGLRGLGRAGVKAVALGPDRGAAGLWSRYAAARQVGSDAAEDPSGFARAVARVSRDHGPLVVYPSREESIDAIIEHVPEMPAGLSLPYPGREALRLIRDKIGLASLAAEAGLRAPRTIREAEAGELLASSLPVPSVIKPARPVGRLGSAYVIETPGRLAEVLHRRRVPADEPILVQERATGTLISLELVIARDGAVAARFQSVARRTWPAEAGSISAAISVEPDEGLVERAAGMLGSAGYWGLAQLDFVDDPKGMTLIDVNPRFYACLPLAIACGVNMPAVWHSVATGGAMRAPAEYRVGLVYRWLKGDVAAAVKGSPRSLIRPGHGRARAGGMWASDDPVPGLLLASRTVTARLGAELARRRSRGHDRE